MYAMMAGNFDSVSGKVTDLGVYLGVMNPLLFWGY